MHKVLNWYLKYNVYLDAQVAIAWILSGSAKSKNVFANNRLKDISKIRAELVEKFGVECKFSPGFFIHISRK